MSANGRPKIDGPVLEVSPNDKMQINANSFYQFNPQTQSAESTKEISTS